MYRGKSVCLTPPVYREKSSSSVNCLCIQGEKLSLETAHIYREKSFARQSLPYTGEKLLDRSFDEWECFRSEMAGVVVDALLGMTPGYVHPEMNKAEERHQNMCMKHLNKCLDL